ncbi:hypothetical protein [Dysgonomonas sp. Marseille-P4677]|uniref:hypothetical protein n=1 Tax=Dysgonomonas sp. Marseille-P4677 TaxID=2364790 RepID=UPI001F37C355|nr:hypothetical protein [Dysgonomonas sp. Marseille-P4677]
MKCVAAIKYYWKKAILSMLKLSGIVSVTSLILSSGKRINQILSTKNSGAIRERQKSKKGKKQIETPIVKKNNRLKRK